MFQRSLYAALLTLLALSGPAQAQSYREVIPAPERPPVTINEDGSRVLAGSVLPDWIVVQNLFFFASESTVPPRRWQSFLEELGHHPRALISATARVLAASP